MSLVAFIEGRKKGAPSAAFFRPLFDRWQPLFPVADSFYGGSSEIPRRKAVFLPEDLTVVRTAAFYLEIFPRRINKGQGLCDICRILKIDVRNSIAFGDSENDIPMLKAAGIGIAMKNAEIDVKKASDMSTLSNNEDGIPYALRALNVI